MKFFTIVQNRRDEKRLTKLKNFYSLDVDIVSKEELYTFKNKKILYLDDVLYGLIKKMKHPSGNKYYTFHKPKYDREIFSHIDVSLIPDLTSILITKEYNQDSEYTKKLRKVPFKKKINKFIFAGTLTGANDMRYNERYKFYEIYKELKNLCNLNIINEIYNKESTLFESNQKHLDKILFKNRIELEEIYSYKYVVNIDGNGSRWGTIADLFSNSIMVRLDTSYELFYEDLLVPFKNYIPFASNFSEATLVDIKRYAEMNENKIIQIIKNANEAAEQVINRVNKWEF